MIEKAPHRGLELARPMAVNDAHLVVTGHDRGVEKPIDRLERIVDAQAQQAYLAQDGGIRPATACG
jgi:hypothetical protein